jgi:SAM-dependent methyltransferase
MRLLKRLVERVLQRLAVHLCDSLDYSTLAKNVSAVLDYERVAHHAVQALDFQALTHQSTETLDYQTISGTLAESLGYQALVNRVADTISAVLEPLEDRLADRLGYMLQLERLLNAPAGKTSAEVFGGVSDDFWLWLNTKAPRIRADLADVLPMIPVDEEAQLGVVCLKGDECLKHAFSVYKAFKGIFEKYNGRLSSCEAILDFGCGWGRVTRFFLREVEPSRLWGIDSDGNFIEMGKQTNKWCRFERVDPLPPTHFSTNQFDFIFSYSVFSHLCEDMHAKWLSEFARILKPGGLFIATTWGRDFIEAVDAFRREYPSSVPDAVTAPYFRKLLTLFRDKEHFLSKYDSGGYCFNAYGPWDEPWTVAWLSETLGETCIPKAYVAAHWTKEFTLLDFVDDREVCDQNVIVVRKPHWS